MTDNNRIKKFPGFPGIFNEEKIMKININTLTKEQKKLLPLSILFTKDGMIDSELIENFVQKKEEITPVIEETTYDFIPDISIYGDMNPIVDRKKLIIEYIKNYIEIEKGSYPFDPSFGNNLKKNLNVKATSLRNEYLRGELNDIVKLTTENFNIPVNLKNFEVIPTTNGIDVYYSLNLEIEIEKEIINLTLS